MSHHHTPSIGIALFGPQACTVDKLLKHADLAMYQAKAATRKTQRFFDPDMQAAASNRAALEEDLRRGLQDNERVLFYPPIVDGKDKLQGAEALVRWRHPRRGTVFPAACAQLVAWSCSTLIPAFFLSVNVSVRQFRQPDFVERVLGALGTSGANPERVKLELT